MYRTNDGRLFVNYKVELNDIRYAVIKEETPEIFEQEINDTILVLVKDGYKIVGISYKHADVYFSAIIEYVAEDNIYYYEEEEEKKDGEQVQE